MLHKLSSIVFFWTFSVEMEKKKKAYFFFPWPVLAQTVRKKKLFSLKI